MNLYTKNKIHHTHKHAMMSFVAVCGVLASILILIAPVTNAAPNYQMNYQGKLTNASNIAVADGTYNMRFWLLASSTVATTSALWTESLTGVNRVQVTNGLFSVMLGSTTPLTGVDFNQTLFLGVEIGSTTGSAVWDGEMSPRKVLGTVPSAFEANKLDGLDSTQFVRTDATSSIATSSASTLLTLTQSGVGDILNIFDGTTEVFTVTDGGRMGLGTTSPSRLFTMQGGDFWLGGNMTATGTAVFNALTVSASSTLGYASTTALTVANNAYLNTFTATAGTTTNATSTNLRVSGLFTLGGDALTDITGNGLQNSSNVLTCITATGAAFGCLTSTDWTTFMGKVASSSIDASSELATLVTDETGTGSLVFSASPTFTGTPTFANLYMSPTGTSTLGFASTTALTVANNAYLNTFTATAGTTTNATSTNLAVTTFKIGNDVITDITGTNLSVTNGILSAASTADGVSNWSYNGSRLSPSTTVGIGIFASSTIGGGTGATGLTINGGATTTGNAYFGGTLGIGTTTPSAKLSLTGTAGNTSLFAFASSTGSNLLTLDARGTLNFGTTTDANIFMNGGATSSNPALGLRNIAIGNQAFSYYGTDGTDAGDNVALGYQALYGSSSVPMTGSGNFAVGYQALKNNTTGTNNIGQGYQALLYNTTGTDNIALGSQALYGSSTVPMTGSNNIAQGTLTLYRNTTGSENIAQGLKALGYNTTGSDNIAQGLESLYYNTTGSNNIAQGQQSLNSNTTGSNNIAQGQFALFGNTTGSENIAQGFFSLRNNTFGSDNTAQGNYTLFSNTTGSFNNALGYNAGYNMTTGTSTLFLGSFTNTLSGSISSSTALGAGALLTRSNSMVLGGTGANSVDIITGSSTPYAKFSIQNNYGSTTTLFDIATTTSASFATSSLFRVNHNGKIGIGTTTPYANLTIAGTMGLTGALYDRTASAGTNGMILQTTSTGVTWVATSTLGIQGDGVSNWSYNGSRLSPSTTVGIGIFASSTIGGGTGATGLTINGGATTTGNAYFGGTLGIGTTSPAGKLTVWGTAGGLLRIGNASDGITLGNETGAGVIGAYDTQGSSYNDLFLRTGLAAGTGIAIKTSGNVGIGTTTPDTRLAIASSGGTTNPSTNTSALEILNTASGASVNSNILFSAATGGTTNRYGAIGGIVTGQGAGSIGSLAFYTKSSVADTTLSERMRIDSSGNVGIGTTTIANRLTLEHNVGGFFTQRIANYSTAGDARAGIEFWNDTNTQIGYIAANGSQTAGGIGFANHLVIQGSNAAGIANVASNASGVWRVLTGGTANANERMRITSTGNVGIGTTSPSAKLSLTGTAGNTSLFAFASSTGSNLLTLDARGTLNFGTTTDANIFMNGGAISSNPGLGLRNVAIGNQAFSYYGTGANDNTALGYQALYGSSSVPMTGINNFAGGYQALYSNTTGYSNTAIGNSALKYNATGNYNTAIGTEAMLGSSAILGSGSNNFASGYRALKNNTTGSFNVAIGENTLSFNTTGESNTAIGYRALYGSSTVPMTGIYNFAAGYRSMFSNTTGSNNNALGQQSLFYNTTGMQNNAFGGDALYGSSTVPMTGSQNNALGSQSLYSNTSGAYNNALGQQSLYYNTTGSYNNALGYQALYGSSSVPMTGTYNNAFGANALTNNTTGSYNNALGRFALSNNISGTDNNTLGQYSLLLNLTGSNNNALGANALRSNTTGSYNNASGYQSLYSNTTGSFNNALGYNAGYNMTTGTSVTFLGTLTDTLDGTIVRSTALGAGALLTRSNSMVLGGTGVNSVDIITGSSTPYAKFSIQNNYGSTTALFDIATTTSSAFATSSIFRVNHDGKVGIGSSTPSKTLSITGDMALSGGFFDTASTSGSNGQYLMSTGTSTRWTTVTASGDGVSNWSYNGSRLSPSTTVGIGIFASSTIGGGTGATGLTINGGATTTGNAYFGGTLGIGTTSPSSILSLTGTAGNTSLFAFASSTGSNLLTLDARGTLNFGTTTDANIFMNGGGTTTNPRASLRNVAIGTQAFSYYGTDANDNVALGYQALYGSSSVPMTGTNNFAVGYRALKNNTTGTDNIAQGYQALLNNTTGLNNIAQGNSALLFNTTGLYNIAQGYSTLVYNTTGSNNIAQGQTALFYNTIGSDNIAQGQIALFYNTTGSYNIAQGSQALGSNTTGSFNNALGYLSGYNMTTGTSTTFLGAMSNTLNGTISSSTALGAGALLTRSNSMVLGGTGASSVDIITGSSTPYAKFSIQNNYGSTTALFDIATTTSSAFATSSIFRVNHDGNVGIGTTTPTQKLTVVGTIQSTVLLGGATGVSTDVNGNLIRDPSDARLKTNVNTIENSLEKVLQLRGVSFNWIDGSRFGEQTEIGFIAQEVDVVLPEVVRKGGEYWSLNTRNIVAVVVEAIKELYQKITETDSRVQDLETRVQELEMLLNQQQSGGTSSQSSGGGTGATSSLNDTDVSGTTSTEIQNEPVAPPVEAPPVVQGPEEVTEAPESTPSEAPTV